MKENLNLPTKPTRKVRTDDADEDENLDDQHRIGKTLFEGGDDEEGDEAADRRSQQVSFFDQL